MTKTGRTITVDKNQYTFYLEKANNFAAAMNNEYDIGDWDAVGLQAVHAVISACDAVLVNRVGIRNAEPDHREAATLLKKYIGEAASPALIHFTTVISKKNLIEYEGKHIYQRDAKELVEHASRFLSWAKGMLPKIVMHE